MIGWNLTAACQDSCNFNWDLSFPEISVEVIPKDVSIDSAVSWYIEETQNSRLHFPSRVAQFIRIFHNGGTVLSKMVAISYMWLLIISDGVCASEELKFSFYIT